MTEKTERKFGTARTTPAPGTPITTLGTLARGFRLGALQTSTFWLVIGLLSAPFSYGITLIIALAVILVQLAIGTPLYFLFGATALGLMRSAALRTPGRMGVLAAAFIAIPLLALTAILTNAPALQSGVLAELLWIFGPVAFLTAPVWGYALGQVCRDQLPKAA